MSFTVLSAVPIAPVDPCALMPTPNVTESERISAVLDAHEGPAITHLMSASHIRILDSYRGWTLYCEGGVTVYRSNPKSEGGHGYAGSPLPGSEEEVNISCGSGRFKCVIRYDAPLFTPDSIIGLMWKERHAQLKGVTSSQIQYEYACFCRKYGVISETHSYGAYPIPV